MQIDNSFIFHLYAAVLRFSSFKKPQRFNFTLRLLQTQRIGQCVSFENHQKIVWNVFQIFHICIPPLTHNLTLQTCIHICSVSIVQLFTFDVFWNETPCSSICRQRYSSRFLENWSWKISHNSCHSTIEFGSIMFLVLEQKSSVICLSQITIIFKLWKRNEIDKKKSPRWVFSYNSFGGTVVRWW